MLLQSLVLLVIRLPFVSAVPSFTAVHNAAKYLYVPPSFCLGITEWYPTILLHFDAKQSKMDDGPNVASYIASYANCHEFGSINVLSPHSEETWSRSCNGTHCVYGDLDQQDLTVSKGHTSYLTGRFAAVFGLMESGTPLAGRAVTLIINVRCADVADYPDIEAVAWYFTSFSSLEGTKTTLSVFWLTAETDFTGCKIANDLSHTTGVTVARIDHAGDLSAMVHGNCVGGAGGGLSQTLRLALEIGIPACVAVVAIVGCICVLTLGQCIGRRQLTKLEKAEQDKQVRYATWDSAGTRENSPDSDSRNSPAIDARHLDVTEIKLGSGAFAAVYKAHYSVRSSPSAETTPDSVITTKSETLEVAVKVLHQRNAVKHRDDILREIEIMEQLGANAHVLQLIGHSSLNNTPVLVLEFCEKGCLLNYLRRALQGHKTAVNNVQDDLEYRSYQNTRLTLKDLISFAWQISDGMSFLSSKGFIHRDLAARNILLTADNVAKISDFGLCRLTDEELYTIQRETKLPVRWMAPECLTKGQFSTQSDVWSYGVLLYEVFSAGAVPYETVEHHELPLFLGEGNRLEQPVLCPLDIYHLMLECWETIPEKRPAFPVIQSYFARCLEQLREECGYISVSMRSDESYMSPRMMSLLV